MALFKKNPDEFSATATDKNHALRDFLILISLIITGPFILVYKIFRGRVKNPFVVFFMLCVVMYCLYQLSLNTISKGEIKTRIIQQTLEEITPEEKEQLRNQISTIRESIAEDKFPKPLAPLLDVPIDMLNINYIIFMLQSGYIKPDGTGSEFILDSYIHANHHMLKEKSWEALHNINSDASKQIIANYEMEIKKKADLLRQQQEAAAANAHSGGSILDQINSKIQDNIQEIKSKARR